MKRIVISILAGVMLLSVGCSRKTNAPELHSIPYPDQYETNQDMDGADAFENTLDHADGKYFTVNDYYNMMTY